MSKEDDNKAVISKWFEGFWSNPWNPNIVAELTVPDVLVHYPLHGPWRGQDTVKRKMTEFREAFPDLKFWGVGDLIAEGDHVVGRWDGGGTHTGPAFDDMALGALPENSGKKMRFTGTTVFKMKDGKIVEEIGEENALVALQGLGIVPKKAA